MSRFAAVVLFLTVLSFPAVSSAQTSQCLYYDLNKDTLVDKADEELFIACVTGPNIGPPALGCEGLDSDGDGDIDQDDFAEFQICYGLSAAVVPPIISEFMASNQSGIEDDYNQQSDWIEIHNPGDAPVRLNGWHLTDDAGELSKWTFPDIKLDAHGYLLVWASNRDIADPAKPLHTSFKLDADGEYLGLIAPDGVTAVSAFYPNFRPQLADASYGVAMNYSSTTLIVPGADCKAFIPTNGNLGDTWTDSPFTEGGWTAGKTGVGYERSPGDAINYTNLIGLNVSSMRNVNRTCYVRVPFLVNDPTIYDRLILHMKYDDGFAAYVNGKLLAWANDPADLLYNAGATADHVDSQSVVYEDFDLGGDGISNLHSGTNILAIQGMNYTIGSSDFLVLPELEAQSHQLIQPLTERYFLTPTPGGPNVGGTSDVGPILNNITATPPVPADTENLLITVKASPSFYPVASVSMSYRIQYNPNVSLAMFDDGTHGDGAAADGVYGATIPASASSPGQMIRYYLTGTDTHGNVSRWPILDDPLNADEYLGTVVKDPALTSTLPILQWFVQNPALAPTNSGTRCSLFYNDEFYDNVFVRIRGNTSRSWPKVHYKMDFNTGHHFKYDPDQHRVEEFNLNSTYSDKAFIRQVLSSETYRDAGVPASIAFPLRVQQNGAFHSVAIFVEQPDEDFLERTGLDPRGALYKCYNQLNSASGQEKKTRQDETISDLQALVTGITLADVNARKLYLYDNVDIPACINYIAATTLMHDNDHVAKNYYVYRDSEDTREWRLLPWDKDLTFGRNFNNQQGVLNDTMWADQDHPTYPATYPTYVGPSSPLFGDSDHQKTDALWHRLIDALNDTPEIREMHMRRLRTLMDQILQPPGTPSANLLYEKRADQLFNLMQVDVALDRAKWAYQYGDATQTFATGVSILKSQYLAVRRTHLFNTHGPSGDALIPAQQPANAVIQFGAVEHSPPSGIQDEEYVQLYNPNSYSVDISGWTFEVDGEVKHTFHPGSVIRAMNSLYATPKAVVFRARTTSPKGGQGLLVQGNYDHHIAPGETIVLKRTDGAVSAQFTIP